MNKIRFGRSAVLAIGISGALTLTACGNDGYDCADPNVKETVYSLLRAPNMLVATLLSSTTIRNAGPIGQAAIGQWYGRIAGAKRSPERKKQIEVRIGEIRNLLSYWDDQEQPIENLKKRVSDADRECEGERKAALMKARTLPPPRFPPPRGPLSKSCDLHNKLRAELFPILDRQQRALRDKPALLQEIGALEAEFSADHRDPPEGEQLVQLKFTDISEQERKSDEKRVVCRGQLSVRVMYPEVMDLGTANILYSVQPNLAAPGNYTVRVNLL